MATQKSSARTKHAEVYDTNLYYDFLLGQVDRLEESYSPKDVNDICIRFSLLLNICPEAIKHEISCRTINLLVHHKYKTTGEIKEIPYKLRALILSDGTTRFTCTLTQLESKTAKWILVAHILEHLNIQEKLTVIP
jgi:hypothetical protein